MISGLKVNGQEKPKLMDSDELIFSWESDGEKQFTVQMASDENFLQTKMYLDTRNNYCTYQGMPLEKVGIYYWRIRSGVKEWVNSEFILAVPSDKGNREG